MPISKSSPPPMGVDTEMTSARFKVTGNHLVFVPQPAGGDVNTPLGLTVEIKNQENQIDTTATSTVKLTLVTISGGTGAVLSGTYSLPFVGGKAIFTTLVGPMINAKGKYKLTATEIDTGSGVLAPSTPVSSSPFAIAGYLLELASPLGPFVADDPDDGGDPGQNEAFEVLDEHHKVVTSAAGLPTMHLTAVPMDGDGTFSGVTPDSVAGTELPVSYLNHDPTVVGTVNRAYYGFHFDFSASGKYQVTIAPSADDPAAGAVEPESIDIVVENPKIVASKLVVIHAGEYAHLSFVTVRPELKENEMINELDMLQLKASVGIKVQLLSSSTKGEITGDTTVAFANAAGVFFGAGGQSNFTYSRVDMPVSFTKGGTYTLAVGEVASPDGQAFDPATATTVTTTTPLILTVKVLADRVAFTTQPPATSTAGQPFSAAVSLETTEGTVLTDAADGSDNLQFVATLTAVGAKGVVTTLATNVFFVGGVATFENLTLPLRGVYRLRVTVTATNSQLGYLIDAGLTAQSNLFTLSSPLT